MNAFLPELTSLWAKTGSGDEFLPLPQHLCDVRAVARQLVMRVTGSTGGWLARLTSAYDGETAIEWLAVLCGLHDVGKVNARFQVKSSVQAERLKGLGLILVDGEPPYHGQVSAYVLSTWLGARWSSVSSQDGTAIARVIGGHHGVIPKVAHQESIILEARGAEPWLALQSLACESVSSENGTTFEPKLGIGRNALLAYLAGLCTVSDWMGSMTGFFPVSRTEPSNAEWLRQTSHRAVVRCGFKPVPTTTHRAFERLFPKIKTRRKLQDLVVHQAQKMPRLVIIEAPTGEGKTEAAMMLAEQWRTTLQQEGAYFALPTQATANQMFERVLKYVEGLGKYHGSPSASWPFALQRELRRPEAFGSRRCAA